MNIFFAYFNAWNGRHSKKSIAVTWYYECFCGFFLIGDVTHIVYNDRAMSETTLNLCILLLLINFIVGYHVCPEIRKKKFYRNLNIFKKTRKNCVCASWLHAKFKKKLMITEILLLFCYLFFWTIREMNVKWLYVS